MLVICRRSYTSREGRFRSVRRCTRRFSECTLISVPETWVVCRCVLDRDSSKTATSPGSRSPTTHPRFVRSNRRTATDFGRESTGIEVGCQPKIDSYTTGYEFLKPRYTPYSWGVYPPISIFPAAQFSLASTLNRRATREALDLQSVYSPFDLDSSIACPSSFDCFSDYPNTPRTHACLSDGEIGVQPHTPDVEALSPRFPTCRGVYVFDPASPLVFRVTPVAHR